MPGCLQWNALNYDSNAGCEGPCYFDCLADYDGNGAMEMEDFLMMLNAFGCLQDCEPYDLDDDTIVGTTDLQIFLTFYGVLCGE